MKNVHVLNLGAGVQSSVIFLMKDLPITHAVFADVMEEPQAVYDHLDWLEKQRPELPVIKRSAGKLGHDLMHGVGASKRLPGIPGYFKKGAAKEGRARRQCTKNYKIEVVDRAIRRDVLGLAPRKHRPKDIHLVQYFGITIDEAGRAMRIKKRFEDKRNTEPRFPLIELGMTRGDCVRWLKDYGIPHEPPRSACVFCPFKSNDEWAWLKHNDPAGWARAVEIDNYLRQGDSLVRQHFENEMYLHRDCLPIEQIDFRKPSERHMAGECTGGCGL